MQGLIGDVWEWTSTSFAGYPGFEPFPYREYSEVFFGPEYRVLRGGSWATDPSACRATFRNWDYPIRRQIFCGFRCARRRLTMCRHLAYLGPPTTLGALLVDAPHGLVDQAHHPRFQTSGHDNPDGWGVAWYEPGQPTPQRHRSPTPIWADADVATLASRRAPVLLGAARLASPGSPVERSGNAPFVAERFAWSLNGVVEGWHDGVGTDLRAQLTPARAAGIEGVSDGEALFALALDRLDAGDVGARGAGRRHRAGHRPHRRAPEPAAHRRRVRRRDRVGQLAVHPESRRFARDRLGAHRRRRRVGPGPRPVARDRRRHHRPVGPAVRPRW